MLLLTPPRTSPRASDNDPRDWRPGSPGGKQGEGDEKGKNQEFLGKRAQAQGSKEAENSGHPPASPLGLAGGCGGGDKHCVTAALDESSIGNCQTLAGAATTGTEGSCAGTRR
mmetsp:Transcript_36832/g.55622  ORF Transcript_36832/g.55622 Transcript_36832/m.55622 type:complete len:113 (+) Transcript_36832:31-369(+)